MKEVIVPLWINVRRNHLGIDDEGRWVQGEGDDILLNWLIENVGPIRNIDFHMPFRGEGWQIIEGFDGDDSIEDWRWRKLAGSHYKSQGKLGFYLALPSELDAVALKLSGVLDDRPVDPMVAAAERIMAIMHQMKPQNYTTWHLPKLNTVYGLPDYVAPISPIIKGNLT